tara:strand:+ start:310 stop:1137 length:828 start_codon:yes stop_codon:yes gene_type:complete
MQSYSLPFKIEDIDFDNIVYKNIKSNSKKTVVFLKYKKKNQLKNLVIQTPSFFNVNSAMSNNTNHYDLDIPLHGKRNDKVNNFVKFLKDLDKKIILDAKINSSAWFSKVDTDELNYQETIRTSEDKKFTNGMIRIKIIKNDDFQTILQLNNQTSIQPEDIPVNSWVKMILEVQAIWINSNGFGLFIKPILVSFIPIEIKKYKFIEDSEDEVDDVIDDNSSIFLNAQEQNNIESTNETSVLKLNSVEDSLELDSRAKFSSTSSEDMKPTSPLNENP